MRAKYKICLIAFGLRLATRSTVNVAMNSWWLRSNHDLKGWVVYDGCHRGISDLLRAIVVTRNNVLVSCKVSSKDGRGKGSVRVDAWVVVVSLDCCAITCCRVIIFVFNAFYLGLPRLILLLESVEMRLQQCRGGFHGRWLLLLIYCWGRKKLATRGVRLRINKRFQATKHFHLCSSILCVERNVIWYLMATLPTQHDGEAAAAAKAATRSTAVAHQKILGAVLVGSPCAASFQCPSTASARQGSLPSGVDHGVYCQGIRSNRAQ